MGNMFLGFPVPRAKIADMIATDAPPTLHKENHEAGGKDELDCTGLVGAGGITLPFDDINLVETVEAKNCLYQYTGASGVISEAGNGVRADTGTTINSHAELIKLLYPLYPALTWPKKRTLALNVDFSWSDGGNDEFWLVSGERGNNRHIGFKVISQVLYGTCYQAAESVVALSGGANPAFAYQAYSLKFVYDGANSVKFYVDGVLRGEITTNIPTGSTDANRLWNLYVKTLTAGWHAAIDINSYSFYQGA